VKSLRWRIRKWWKGEPTTHTSSLSEYSIFEVAHGFKDTLKGLYLKQGKRFTKWLGIIITGIIIGTGVTVASYFILKYFNRH
jgi:hypothetical protein